MPSVALVVLGSVFVLLGIPLAAGRVPPNGIYGFRTPATVADPSLWYRVNRIAGIDLAVGGALLLLVGILWPALRSVLSLGSEDAPVSLLAAGVAAVVVIHGLVTIRSRDSRAA